MAIRPSSDSAPPAGNQAGSRVGVLGKVPDSTFFTNDSMIQLLEHLRLDGKNRPRLILAPRSTKVTVMVGALNLG